jgi:DEAD/DEAH box helicase
MLHNTLQQDDAADRKRKRLEAWRNRQKQQQEQQQQSKQSAPAMKIVLSKKKPKPVTVHSNSHVVSSFNAFDEDDDTNNDPQENNSMHLENRAKAKLSNMMEFELNSDPKLEESTRKRRRWDVEIVEDALDSFMEKLQDGAVGQVEIRTKNEDVPLKLQVDGSMMRLKSNSTQLSENIPIPTSTSIHAKSNKPSPDSNPHYTHSDWESEAPSELEDEEEDCARRTFLEALKAAPVPKVSHNPLEIEEESSLPTLSTAAEVRTEKQRREDRLKQLTEEAEMARVAATAEADLGRLYNDGEDGVMEEAERYLEAAMTAPDALDVLADLNKKKELKSVDHSQIDYIKFRKNLYIVPRSLANLSQDEIINRRAKLKIRVRGKAAPAPVSSWTECGVSERIIKILDQSGIINPYPIQAQCIPCIMAGRDVIGIAKTGSGKTLAYLLPLLRHIGDQPELGPQESGPIGLILAPARELASQIHSVCKGFCKILGLK